MSTPPTPGISPDCMLREHLDLDDLRREVALLREMVARQRERKSDRQADVQSSSRDKRPTTSVLR